jgi:hypothetical protein
MGRLWERKGRPGEEIKREEGKGGGEICDHADESGKKLQKLQRQSQREMKEGVEAKTGGGGRGVGIGSSSDEARGSRPKRKWEKKNRK